MKKAICTLLFGHEQQARWETYSRSSWEAYARRHGFQIVAHAGAIDPTEEARERSLAWQKLLLFRLPELAEFDRVVWMAPDVIVNPSTAPDVTEGVPPEKVGMTIAHLMLAYPGMGTALERLCGMPSLAEHARSIYAENSLPAFDYYLSTGVMVLSRAHQEVLEYVYDTYPEQPRSFGEQMALSSVLLQRELLHPIDPRFNALWYEHKYAFYPFLLGGPKAVMPLCIAAVYANSFFLHFAGVQEEAAMFDPNVRVEGQSTVVPKAVLSRMADALDKLARAPDPRA